MTIPDPTVRRASPSDPPTRFPVLQDGRWHYTKADGFLAAPLVICPDCDQPMLPARTYSDGEFQWWDMYCGQGHGCTWLIPVVLP